MHLVGILSSRFAHDARSQEHKTLSQFVLQYFLLFHCSCFYTNAPHCYIIRTLALLFRIFIGEERAELLKGICKLWLWNELTLIHFVVDLNATEPKGILNFSPIHFCISILILIWFTFGDGLPVSPVMIYVNRPTRWSIDNAQHFYLEGIWCVYRCYRLYESDTLFWHRQHKEVWDQAASFNCDGIISLT